MPASDFTCDLLIIGAGPAGCTAALYAARAGLHTVMLSPSEVAGMMASAPLVGNFPGQLEPAPGREILARLRQQALRAGAQHILQAVSGVTFNGEQKLVYAGRDTHCARAVIVATGAMAPTQKAPGETEFLGRGVCYCAACDGPLYRNQDVIVIGQDDQAAEEALTLAGMAKSVCVVCPTPAMSAAERLCRALEAQPNVTVYHGLKLQEILGDEGVTGARFITQEGQEKTLQATGVFLYLRGTAPVTDFLYGALETDEKGFIKTDELCHTSVPGVFAAGDVRSKQVRQMVVACAEGAIAALAAERLIRQRSTVRLDRGAAKA